MCACKSGYQIKVEIRFRRAIDPAKDGKLECVNVNECLNNNGGCSFNAKCTDTIGSRTCQCKDGYAGIKNSFSLFSVELAQSSNRKNELGGGGGY